MILFEILWWVACLLIVLGLLQVLEAVELDRSLDDEEDDEGYGGMLLGFLYIRIFLLIVPAVYALLLFWFFNLAPETLGFLRLGSPSN